MSRYILILFLTTVFVNQISEINGARILGIFPLPAPSHYSLGHKLMNELAKRGHEITMINSYGQKEPMKNYKDVVIKGLIEEMESFHKSNDIIEENSKSISESLSFMMKITNTITEKTMESPEIKKLVYSGEKFDLIVMDAFLNEAHVVFAHYFDAPLVVLSSLGADVVINQYFKNPAPVSFCPTMLLAITRKMSFTERLANTIITTSIEALLHGFHFPNQNALVQKHFPGAPKISDIVNERLSLILMNSHPSISPALPLVPNMIEIGGFHVDEPKELPKDLKAYLDGANEGFILFSMGSNVKSTMLPEDKRNILLTVFKELPYKVLWKFEDENLPGKPENVRIEKWLPQNDILAHPNLKLFITHGGLLSTTEAVYHAVPIVGIPVFGDQKMNMERAKSLGIGETIDFMSLNYNDLSIAIQEVINNKKYLENIRNRSILLHDQPLHPLDAATFWIEHAIRHKSNNHLKTSAVHLTLLELWNLDVIAFLGAVVFVIVYSFYWILKKLFSSCFKQKTNTIIKKQETKKKKN